MSESQRAAVGIYLAQREATEPSTPAIARSAKAR
jgi:hypothetical protein